jgi:hypothetical protein
MTDSLSIFMKTYGGPVKRQSTKLTEFIVFIVLTTVVLTIGYFVVMSWSVLDA